MKKKIFVLSLLLSSGVMAFAGKQNSNINYKNITEQQPEELTYNPIKRVDHFLDKTTIVTVEGTLDLVNGDRAKLISGDTTYTIMAPWDQLTDLEVKNGMLVTFEGSERTNPINMDGSEKTLIATKLTVSGKTKEIDFSENSKMMGGTSFRN